MTYTAEVLADSPIGYWRLGEAAGTTAVDAGSGSHNGTYVGSPTLGVAGLVGDANTAVTFNGTSQDVLVTNPGAWFAGDFTIEVVLKTTSTKAVAAVLAKYTPGVSGDRGPILFIQNGLISLDGRDGTGTYRTTGNDGVRYNDGAAHHVVAARRGNVWELWIDGCRKRAVDMGEAGDMSNSDDLGIAFYPGDPNWYAGTLDEVAVYNGSALTAPRIRAHAAAAALAKPCGRLPHVRIAQRGDSMVRIAKTPTRVGIPPRIRTTQ